MKKIYLIAFYLLLIFNCHKGYACEICSSGFGSYIGILPQYGQHFLGVRWQTQTFRSIPNPLYPSEEVFNQYEIWGRFNIIKKIQFLVFVPYFTNYRTQYGRRTEMQGLGDISLQANYILFNSGDSIFTPLKQTLTSGIGVKLPSGKYQNPEGGQLVNPNFQLGTGSTDYFINLIYTIRYGKFGLNLDLRQKFNGENPTNQHQFGNQTMISGQFFWWQNFGKFSLLPTLGVYYENSQPNTFETDIQEHTGGNVSFWNVGTELYLKYLSVGFSYQKPFSQNLAEGEIIAENRFSLHTTFIF